MVQGHLTVCLLLSWEGSAQQEHLPRKFSLIVPAEPKTLDSMTKDELDVKLQHSYDQSLRGEGRPFEDVFDDLERGLA